MGRKKRRRGQKFQHVAPKGSVRHPPPQKERFTRHLDRPGQVSQLLGNVRELPGASGVPHQHMGPSSVFTLKRVWEFPHPRNCEFRQHANSGGLRFPLFHGTHEAAAAHIMLQGFRLPKNGGMFGRATYLTPDIGKAFGYTSYDNPLVFICEAYLGRVHLASEADTSMNLSRAQNAGFDTIHGKSKYTRTWGSSSLFYSEYAVYDPTRIRLLYLAEYSVYRKLHGR